MKIKKKHKTVKSHLWLIIGVSIGLVLILALILANYFLTGTIFKEQILIELGLYKEVTANAEQSSVDMLYALRNDCLRTFIYVTGTDRRGFEEHKGTIWIYPAKNDCVFIFIKSSGRQTCYIPKQLARDAMSPGKEAEILMSYCPNNI